MRHVSSSLPLAALASTSFLRITCFKIPILTHQFTKSFSLQVRCPRGSSGDGGADSGRSQVSAPIVLHCHTACPFINLSACRRQDRTGKIHDEKHKGNHKQCTHPRRTTAGMGKDSTFERHREIQRMTRALPALLCDSRASCTTDSSGTMPCYSYAWRNQQVTVTLLPNHEHGLKRMGTLTGIQTNISGHITSISLFVRSELTLLVSIVSSSPDCSLDHFRCRHIISRVKQGLARRRAQTGRCTSIKHKYLSSMVAHFISHGCHLKIPSGVTHMITVPAFIMQEMK